MVKLYDGGAYLVNGTEIITDEAEVKAKTGRGTCNYRRNICKWLCKQ